MCSLRANARTKFTNFGLYLIVAAVNPSYPAGSSNSNSNCMQKFPIWVATLLAALNEVVSRDNNCIHISMVEAKERRERLSTIYYSKIRLKFKKNKNKNKNILKGKWEVEAKKTLQ
jgi:hypothetical protein